jgi:hypothetical protein
VDFSLHLKCSVIGDPTLLTVTVVTKLVGGAWHGTDLGEEESESGGEAPRPCPLCQACLARLQVCMVREAGNRSAPFILGGTGEPARQNVCIHLSCNIWVILIWYLVDTDIISGWYSGGYGQDCYVVQPFLLRHKTPCSSALFFLWWSQGTAAAELQPRVAVFSNSVLLVFVCAFALWSPLVSSGLLRLHLEILTLFHVFPFPRIS